MGPALDPSATAGGTDNTWFRNLNRNAENQPMKITRRDALGLMAVAPAAAAAEPQAANPAGSASGEVLMNWLDGAPPPLATGVSWGVPWPKGAVKKDRAFALYNAANQALPLQSWPLAWWGDGSVKWTAFSTVTPAKTSGPLRLAPGTPAAPSGSVSVKGTTDGVEVHTGAIWCVIPFSGSNLIETLSMAAAAASPETAVARKGRLVCTLEDRSQWDSSRTIRMEEFASAIKKVTVEQSGPVRAVVRIEGVHKAEKGPREWLPFTVRLYFYAGQTTIRLIHTIIFDGDDQKDFIRGLGVTFQVPMREQPHNRHVRFGGETQASQANSDEAGLWAEPIQPLTGRRVLQLNRRDVYPDQLAGLRVPNKDVFDRQGQDLINDWAVWDSYKLVQSSADGFTIQKRATDKGCWLDAAAGRRATGYVFAGDVGGGLGAGLRNFWQSFPSALEVVGAATNTAELRVWMWSPDAPAMDMRHYDTRAHGLEASYEDVQPGFSTPHGVGRTSEITLFPSAGVPTRPDSQQHAYAAAHPPLLVCAPAYLHSAGAFGVWSLPDRSNAAKKWVEDQLDAAFAYYQKEVDQRHWYGFWNYGDIMHTYDTARHMWRYDIGGFAWDNSELGPDLWLWYSFARSGRADVFRMAEAMTRHTGEVDTYHLGRFAKLGSRHNVRHWGCGAKELRISQAAYRRFYYYLTTDERTGDLMHEVTDADYTLLELDPMRLASPAKADAPKYPARIRGGPDWLAAVGNWMTEWERTGNTKYRDKIVTGMDCFAAMKYGFLSGPDSLFGYDPATGKVYPLSNDPYGSYNLQVIMGGAEVAFELEGMLDHPGWSKTWLQYCRLVGATREVILRDMTTGTEDVMPRVGPGGGTGPGPRLAAYCYARTKDPKYALRAWNAVLRARNPMSNTRKVSGADSAAPIEEVPGVSTNSTAQWCLNAIEVLALCADQAPDVV
jgi:hypothetical protein